MRIVDTFAGCGGLSKGFGDAGFKIKAAFEYWDAAIECYQANFTHPVIKQDLSDVPASISAIKKLKPDMIIGGPPCQDFSHAGKRDEGDRASLTAAFVGIIEGVRPKYFIMENVDRASKSKTYLEARELLKRAGYGLNERVLNASYCGVPQRRKRFFCVGALGESDGFLDSHIDKNLSKTETTIRHYLSDELGLEFYYRHPRNYSCRGVFSIDEPSPTVRGVNRPIPKGYLGHHGDPAHIDTPDLRPLSTLERARLQTFPKTFKWVGSKTDMEQIIGNAVPVKLAEFVAVALKDYLKSKGV